MALALSAYPLCDQATTHSASVRPRPRGRPHLQVGYRDPDGIGQIATSIVCNPPLLGMHESSRRNSPRSAVRARTAVETSRLPTIRRY